MSKITLALNVQVEADSAQEVLPLLQGQLQQLVSALQALAASATSSPDVIVTLPHIEVGETPDWKAPHAALDFGGDGHA